MATAQTKDYYDDANKVKNGVIDGAKHFAETVEEKGRKAAKRAGEAAHDALERGEEYGAYAVRKIKDHPIASVGIGLAVGGIVALLLSRR